MSTKVFVGNLMFSTTDADLKDAFSSYGNVVQANIITRGRRSLGYGFVEMATELEAANSVTGMNKSQLGGRAINVELARPRDAAKEEESRQARQAAKAAAASNNSASTATNTEAGAVTRRGRPGLSRRRRRPTGNGTAAPAATGIAKPAEGTAPAAANNGNGKPRGPRRPPHVRRSPSTTEKRPPSETTLFVANLPFEIGDDELKGYFAEHKPTSAHVMRLKKSGRSRGYGFVEFDTKQAQEAGLAVNGMEITGTNGPLKLIVKIAMVAPPPRETTEASSSAAAATPEAK